MLKGNLVDAVSDRLDGFMKKDVRQVVDIIVDTMSGALNEGKRVEIRGFGSFSVRQRRARKAANPKTGKIMDIPQRKSVLFTMSKSLKKTLIRGEE